MGQVGEGREGKGRKGTPQGLVDTPMFQILKNTLNTIAHIGYLTRLLVEQPNLQLKLAAALCKTVLVLGRPQFYKHFSYTAKFRVAKISQYHALMMVHCHLTGRLLWSGGKTTSPLC